MKAAYFSHGSLRSAINLMLEEFAKRRCTKSRRVDRSLLYGISAIAAILRHPEAEVLRQDWFLDSLYLLADAIATTPYGQELAFRWPLVITIGVTKACPYQCQVCYSDSVPYEKAETFPTDKLNELLEMPTPHFFISGGEPLTVPNLPEVVERILLAKKNLYIATNTSAKSLEHLFHKFPLQITIFIPLWGGPRSHDAFRGQGSFRRTLDHLRYLCRQPVRCTLNYTVTEENMEEIPILDKLVKEYRIHRVYISRPIAVGRRGGGKGFTNDPSIDPRIRDSLRRLKLARNKMVAGISKFGEGKTKAARFSTLSRFIGLSESSGCAAGRWMMHVTHDGRCYPCFAAETSPATATVAGQRMHHAWEEIRAAHCDKKTDMYCLAKMD